MGKKAYGTIIAVFILVSIGMGIASYYGAVKIHQITAQLDKFEWVIPLGRDYSGFSGDEKSPYFTGTEENTYDEVIFDENGSVVATGTSFFSEDKFYAFEENGLQGIKTVDEKLLISATFNYISSFDGNYGVATDKNEIEVVFDKEGKVIYQAPLANASLWQIKGSLYSYNVNGAEQVIDVEIGETVFESKELAGLRYGGEDHYLADCYGAEYTVLLNKDFEPALGGQIFMQLNGFSQGYCYAEKVQGGTLKSIPGNISIVNGYMDKYGKAVIETKGCQYGTDFSEDKAIVYYEEKIRCINTKGETLFELPIEEVKEPQYAESFNSGKAIVLSGDKMGLIDETGQWLIPPDFDVVKIVGPDLVSVLYGEKWGVLRIGGMDYAN